MPWFKVDDNFSSHPKVKGIQRSKRMAAVGVWTTCGNWSARHSTDGLIPRDAVDDEGGKQSDAKLLVDANLWHSNGHECPRCVQPPKGDYVFHDWLDYQPSAEEVQSKRDSETQRKAEYRARKAAEKDRTKKPERPSVPPSVPTGHGWDSQRTSGVSPGHVPDQSHASRARTRTQTQDAAPTEPVAEPPGEVHAGMVIAAWYEACKANGVTPSTAQRGQVGKQAKELLRTNDPARVLEAAAQAGAKGFASIDRELTAMNGRHIPSVRQTQLSTAERMAAVQSLKRGPANSVDQQLALGG